MEISTAGNNRRRIESVGQWRAASRRAAADWSPFGPAAYLAKLLLVDDALGPSGAFTQLLARGGLPGFFPTAATVEPPLLPAHFVNVGGPHHLLVEGQCGHGALTVAVDVRSDAPFGDETIRQRMSKEDGTAPGLDGFVEKIFTGPAEAAEELALPVVALVGSALLHAKSAHAARAAVLFIVLRHPYLRPAPLGQNAIAVDAVVRHLSSNRAALLDQGAAGPLQNRLGPPLTILKSIVQG